MLRDRGEIYDFQRVEITGVFSADDTNASIPGFNDKELNPAHNSVLPDLSDRYHRFLNSYGISTATDDAKDLTELFDDKTGKLTQRGRDVVGLLGNKDIRVNEIVAHSWGSLILNNAILEGLVAPPKRIVVVGCPDTDMTRWRLLAQKTGTEVVVFMNTADMIAGVPMSLDNFKKDPEVRAFFDRVYDEGRIAQEWGQWKNPDPDRKIVRGKFLELRANIGAVDLDKFAGHSRINYYQYLLQQGVLGDLVTMTKQQDQKVAALSDELEERDVENMVKKIKAERAEADRQHDAALKASLQSVAETLCTDADSLTQEELDRLPLPVDRGPFLKWGTDESPIGSCRDGAFRILSRMIATRSLSLGVLEVEYSPRYRAQPVATPPEQDERRLLDSGVPAATPPEIQEDSERQEASDCVGRLRGIAHEACSSGGMSMDRASQFHQCWYYLATVGAKHGTPAAAAAGGLSGCDAAVFAAVTNQCVSVPYASIFQCIANVGTQTAHPPPANTRPAPRANPRPNRPAPNCETRIVLGQPIRSCW